MIRTVAICGVGLIGGSFGLALRKAGFGGEIVGVSSPKTIENACKVGAIDRGVSLPEAAAQADLIYLAQPISVILATLPLLDAAKPAALITDAGSTKRAIVEAARRPQRAAQFLGGHPMAGKEVQGVLHAEADLFVDRSYFLTPESDSDAHSEVATEFQNWLTRIRCKVHFARPAEHDRIVAYTSHLAQLASTGLAGVVGARLADAAIPGAGPGLQDMTRLAMSGYDLWADILATNVGEIDAALAAYISQLTDIKAGLQKDLENHFKSASIFAKSLRNR
jgi:prephenate dehydrogenase